MRRVLLSVLAAAVALTGLALTTASPAGAEGLVDLSAVTSADPEGSVSPPGALAFYTATFTNEGALALEGTFSNATTGGTVVSVTADDTCTVSGNTVTCVDTLPAGATKVVNVVVQSPTTAGSTITNVSAASVNPGLVSFIDLYPANNSSTVTTNVLAADTVGSAGFIREGESLSYKKHKMTVLEAELGVVGFLSDTPAAPALSCGGNPCKQGLRVDFAEGGEDERFYGLVKVEVNFGTTDPCRGYGAASGCADLYYLKPGMTAPVKLPACTATSGMPCQAGVSRNGGLEFVVDVRLDTDDPDLLSPVKNLAGGVSG